MDVFSQDENMKKSPALILIVEVLEKAQGKEITTEKLAQAIGQSRRQVKEHLKLLKENGIISCEGIRNSNRGYRYPVNQEAAIEADLYAQL